MQIYYREGRIRESYKVVREKSGLNRYAGLLFKGLMVGMFSIFGILGIINKELKIRNKEVDYFPIFYQYNRNRNVT
jgi:hypothetical protein